MTDDGISAAEVLELYGVVPVDRDACTRLLADPASAPGGVPAVDGLLDRLRRDLGAFAPVAPGRTQDPLTALAAYLAFAPEIVAWHQARGVGDDVTRATLADVGRQLALHRQTYGELGLETWWWLAVHMAGALFQLGRLQHQLHRQPTSVPGVVEEGEWVLGLHIPPTGPLGPAEVDRSLATAGTFFARHFPDQPVRVATCTSWLLDPYLVERLAPQSNTAQFARRFTVFGDAVDSADDAMYFTFRTRDLGALDQLPRQTSLQRTVLERIEAGGTWQVAIGYLRL